MRMDRILEDRVGEIIVKGDLGQALHSENMMSVAAQIGIDSCPIEGFDREKLEPLLEQEGMLDATEFGVSVMVAFGYRENEPFPKTRHREEAVIEWY